MSQRTTFTDPAAVETWDGCFRWRDGSVLHDRTIDATWSRVVLDIGRPEQDAAAAWADRWLDGLSRWKWLPDEIFLRCAGTGAPPRVRGPVVAALNLNAFVRQTPFGATPGRLDVEAIVDTASLVMRFLDDALLAMPEIEAPGVRIGLLGMADAFAAVGVEYDSAAALRIAHDAGAAMASGALRGAVALARERGGTKPKHGRLEFLSARGLPRSLVDDAQRHGVRHEVRTAISPAPKLALLANNVADAVDPLPPGRVGGGHGNRSAAPTAFPSAAAQQAIRTVLQPWIDEPIDYPLALPADPSAAADASSAGPDAATSRPPVQAKTGVGDVRISRGSTDGNRNTNERKTS